MGECKAAFQRRRLLRQTPQVRDVNLSASEIADKIRYFKNHPRYAGDTGPKTEIIVKCRLVSGDSYDGLEPKSVLGMSSATLAVVSFNLATAAASGFFEWLKVRKSQTAITLKELDTRKTWILNAQDKQLECMKIDDPERRNECKKLYNWKSKIEQK